MNTRTPYTYRHHPIQWAELYDNQGRYVGPVTIPSPSEVKFWECQAQKADDLARVRRAYTPTNYNDPIIAWAHGLIDDPLA